MSLTENTEPPYHNVIVHLHVVRPDLEYFPELLRHRLTWDSYSGHMYVGEVEILWGASPFPPCTADEAIASLPEPEKSGQEWLSALHRIAHADLRRCSAGWLQRIAMDALIFTGQRKDDGG